MESMQLGEYGIPIVFQQSTYDISAATIYILYTKPSGVEGRWTASIDGTNFYYTLQEDDIDEIGVWVFHGLVVWPTKRLWTRVSLLVRACPTDRIP